MSFGSLGSGDTRYAPAPNSGLGELPLRALVNVGGYVDVFPTVPGNVIVDKWFPQPSVIPQVDGVIHHGGNNTFTECLYFGKPSIIMPYVWDGHDNATRVHETGSRLENASRELVARGVSAKFGVHILDRCNHERAARGDVRLK